MPDTLRDNLIQRLLIDYDFVNPPSDFGSMNILENPSQEMTEFKEKVILPSFDRFLQETTNNPISYWEHYRMHGWMTGTGNDYSLNLHNHRGAQLSAVFYLLCEEQDKGGFISFTDPRVNANRGYDKPFYPWFEDLNIQPKSGDVVVFPSFLYHYVATYHGNIRVAIPVDLFLRTNK